MKRPVRNPDTGKYVLNGQSFSELFGSRQQVWNGTAYKTSGGLTKDKLVMNKWNRIVSKTKQITAKKEKRLEKAGYFAEKGKFGFVKRETSKNRKSKSSKTVGKYKV
jgi:hypothetical protein